MFRRIAVYSALVAGLAFLAGCGDSQVDTYQAKGTLKIKGLTELPPGLMLTLISTEADKSGVQATAPVSTDGSFAFGTYEDGDGAPEGKYKVVITAGGGGEDAMRKRAESMVGKTTSSPEEMAKSMLGAAASVDVKYRDAGKTPLTIDVSTDESKNDYTLELDAPVDIGLPGGAGGGIPPM